MWGKMKAKFAVIAGVVVFSVSALSIKDKELKNTDVFPPGLDIHSVKNVKSLAKTAQIQWHTQNSNWTNCVELSESLHRDTSLGVWLPFNHLWCLNKAYTTKTRWKVGRFLSSFQKIEHNKVELLNSPFSGHRDRLLNVFLDLAQLASENARNEFDEFIERNHGLVDYMDERQRAKYYKIMGEIAWLRQKNTVAAANFLRSYGFAKDAEVLGRIKTLKVDEDLELSKYSLDSNESAEEAKLWDIFSSANKRGQTYKVAKYGAQFLNQFPGSRRVDDVEQLMGRYHKRLLYRRGSKYVSIKKDFEKQLSKAPPQHILFWAKEAYARGYHDSSYRLADQAADSWEGSREAADALLLAARSAYYLVKRSAAKVYLNTLIEKYSGHEASHEAHYLLGLLYYREREYKKVINLYDSFLTSSSSDKWELQVRYWLWRSLRKIESSRAKDVAETIFKTFPLTYYGLIVRMEEKGTWEGLMQGPTKVVSTQYWWTKYTEKRWQRIRALAASGWLDEAETEVDYLPDPQLAEGFLVRAELWRAIHRPNRAIQDYASAIDLDPKYINPAVLVETFPQAYKEAVEKAEDEFSLSTSLIWSIMRQESAFRPRAVSPSNAYGLMQMLAGTAKETAKWLRVKNFSVTSDVFDPAVNIRFGTHFLSRMTRKYKNVVPLAVASYNVGPGNLDRWLSHRSDLSEWEKIGPDRDDDIWMDELPWEETSFYVKAVMRNYLLYKIIHEKAEKLPTIPWSEAVVSK